MSDQHSVMVKTNVVQRSLEVIQYCIQIAYFVSGIYFVLTGLYIQDHSLSRIINLRIQGLFGPNLNLGSYLLLMCIINLHYLSCKGNKTIFTTVFFLINLTILGWSFKNCFVVEEENFRSVFNLRLEKEHNETIQTFISEQC